MHSDNDDMPKQSYEPTPAEIKAECWKIQDGWDERERWRRRGFADGRPFLECQRVRNHYEQRRL